MSDRRQQASKHLTLASSRNLESGFDNIGRHAKISALTLALPATQALWLVQTSKTSIQLRNVSSMVAEGTGRRRQVLANTFREMIDDY